MTIITGRIGTPYSRVTRLMVGRVQTTVVATPTGWVTLTLRDASSMALTLTDA